MTQFFYPKPNRIKLYIIGISFTLLLSISMAQESNTGKIFDETVLELLLESRFQKPASQASSSERASAIEELTNIYVISNLPRTIELGKSSSIKTQLELQEKIILFNAFANDFMASNRPNEQEIFNIYEEQVALKPLKEFKARHILVDTKIEALSLIKQLQDGVNFASLAKENSIGPSATAGGDLGWFAAQVMVKPFSDAVVTMEEGSYTPAPVQTQFGWHVILLEETRDSVPPTLDSIRKDLVQRLTQQKFQDFIDDLHP